MNHRRIMLTFAAAAGGMLAAAFLPMAVAVADVYDLVPDPPTFQSQNAIGYPPIYNEVIGLEKWSTFDTTTGKLFLADQMLGNDTHTTFGSFTNDDFIVLKDLGGASSPPGTEIDFADYGGGFGNEWINFPGQGISDLFITPFGDVPIEGTFF